jgi:hypothetical protein
MLVVFAVAFAGLAPAAHAVQVYQAVLAGSNEVPPNGSAGFGIATATISDALDFITITANFSGLGANTVAAHIHCCGPAGSNAGVAIETPSLPGFPLGVQAGNFSNGFSLLDANNYNPPFVAANGGTAAGARDALLAGLASGRSYFNIHTTQFPGGEIRGQFAAVPEPASWALMIAGFGMVGAAMRKRKVVIA